MSLTECFVVGVDVQRFSPRTVRCQVKIQRDLVRILDEASESAGISRSLWNRRPEGDGETAILPPGIDLVAAVRRFITELDWRLTDHNELHQPNTQIRLRVAMHSDVLAEGSLGHAGPALAILRRLLDSAPVRQALTPEVNLAQIISETLYRKAVVPELDGVLPRQFRKVLVHLPDKDFRQTAYVYVPTQPAAAPRQAPAAGTGGSHGGWPSTLVSLTSLAPEPPPGQPPENTPAPRGKSRPASETAPLTPEVQELVREVRKALSNNNITEADNLTTLAVLEAAGRSEHGSLRTSDGPKLPDALFTEIDSAWVEFSGGRWGFRAQRQRTDGHLLSRPTGFRALSVQFGWLSEQGEMAGSYNKFIRRADYGTLFYPTLRNPRKELEPHSRWHDEWRATVMSVHLRLQRWE